MVRMGAQAVKSEDDISGFQKPLPGRYHVVVKDVDESFEKFDKIGVEFEVLAGTVPDQAGRTLSEFFSCTEKSVPRLQRLALCVGLLQPGEADKDVEFTEAIGHQLVIEVEDGEYEKEENGQKVKKKKTALSYLGMWRLGNAAVADVPKAADVMGRETKAAATAAASAAQPSQQQRTTQPAMPPVAKGGSDWDNI